DSMKIIREKLSDPKVNPRDVKRDLARDLVTLYYDETTARDAEAEFDRIFIKKDIPDDIPTVTLKTSIPLVALLARENLVSSKTEARRLIKQRAVRINSQVCDDMNMMIEPGEKTMIIKVGKRRFLKVVS
ncbi:MAG: tyrosine--tRNA ligase, partial [FCB group bacterium]|nr:tyrosine--tRNA ligase [FCB group bacterium]